MPENRALSDLQAMAALAAEEDALLAFRVCEESGELEPVFMRIFCANPGESSEAALLAIEDGRGLSLGRYVVGREQLERALAEAEDVEAEEPEPVAPPADWT